MKSFERFWIMRLQLYHSVLYVEVSKLQYVEYEISITLHIPFSTSVDCNETLIF
jgi:hypothetical protein